MRSIGENRGWIVLAALGALTVLAAPTLGAATGAAAGGGNAVARARMRVTSPDGRRVAEVRSQPRGGEGVYLDGRRVWPDDSAPRTIGVVAWSRRCDAFAFVSNTRGLHELVVVVAPAGVAPAAMRWAIPDGSPARAITWLGPSRVGVGAALLDPKVVASWQSQVR